MSDPQVDQVKLFNEVKDGVVYPTNEKWYSHLLDQYKLYVEMADRISQRRATANTYFLSVNSAILAFVGYLTSKDSTDNLWMLAVAGVVLCWLWKALITSYKNLNTAKYKIVHAIERRLPISLYESEWAFMGRGTDPKLYRPLSYIEGWVPWVFFALHVIALYQTCPWQSLAAKFTSMIKIVGQGVIEGWVPWVFSAPHVIAFYQTFPWQSLAAKFTSMIKIVGQGVTASYYLLLRLIVT